ncbi:hypothetical protein EST38_g14152 [Candolleomyces aberdarensis]|uniref:Uncharacterized protein n=1 Tax=Candolleomyces aberdarensis TaxID=2316362 RepID=A0A4Q2CY53_9AGAR|nr:hypothetical protein EST38_g14152 [Candolleomyces aberdarensis]
MPGPSNSKQPKSSKSKGKQRARSTTPTTAGPSQAPAVIPAPPIPRSYETRKQTQGRPVRTLDKYQILASALESVEPFLNPCTAIPTDEVSYRRLFMGISRLQPHINAVFHDFDTCMNADLADLCDHVSFFFRRLAPDHFERVLNKPAWSWVNTNTPTSRFGGLQTSGEAYQVTGDLPDLVPSSPSPSVATSLVAPSGPSREVISIHDTDDEAEPATPTPPDSVSTDESEDEYDKLQEEMGEEEEEARPLTFTLPAAPSKAPSGPSARKLNRAGRPSTVIAHSKLLPPIGVQARVSSGKKRHQKHEDYEHTPASRSLPVYERGPLFLQSAALHELTVPLNTGPVPDWVRPPCGQCASHGLVYTGGDLLNGVRCDQCARLKQTCGFDTRVPRFQASQQMSFGGEESPWHITALVSDILNLRATAQIAASHAEDLRKMTEAKLGTLSLVLQRVYSNRGDAGLNEYVQDVKDFQELLEYAKDVPLDTPMLFPQRLNATVQKPEVAGYHWSTDYESSILYNPPSIDDDLGSLSYASDDAMDVEPSRLQTPPYKSTLPTHTEADLHRSDLVPGPSLSPGAYETPQTSFSELEADAVLQAIVKDDEDRSEGPSSAPWLPPPAPTSQPAPAATTAPNVESSTPPHLDLRHYQRSPRKGFQSGK